MSTNKSELEKLEREKELIEDALQNLGTNPHIYSKERKKLNRALEGVNNSLKSIKSRNKIFQELEKNYEQATGKPLRINTLSTVRC